jgi:hypothetical protein
MCLAVAKTVPKICCFPEPKNWLSTDDDSKDISMKLSPKPQKEQ